MFSSRVGKLVERFRDIPNTIDIEAYRGRPLRFMGEVGKGKPIGRKD